MEWTYLHPSYLRFVSVNCPSTKKRAYIVCRKMDPFPDMLPLNGGTIRSLSLLFEELNIVILEFLKSGLVIYDIVNRDFP